MTDRAATTPERIRLTWETRVRLLTNPSVWSSMLLAFGIPSVLLGLFFAVIAKRPEFALLIPLGSLSILFGIYIVVALVIDAFGGFKATYFITTDGVRAVSGRGAKTAVAVAVLAGALAGKPGLAGAGMLAESEQDVFIPWEDIRTIKVKPGRRFIHINREWGSKPIGLYCTAENFQEVIGILRTHAGDKLPHVST